ncbi:uncharacterized protein LOC141850716 [Brevipalpus obovatus]|uniref:uncharacterized protein LOC141850716 n=1 Tax=Brevipalpus obovatus TaxID=246614 RepID=UPI003D9EF590
MKHLSILFSISYNAHDKFKCFSQPSSLTAHHSASKMFSLQYSLGFLLVSCLFSLGTSIVLRENDIRTLCTETRSGDLASNEAFDHVWKSFKGHLTRSAGKSQDETVDEMLVKSLVDDFTRGKTRQNFPGDGDDRSIIAKYKVKQKKYASTDITDIIAIGEAMINSASALTMRQTHDKVKGSKVDKKIIFIQPSVTMKRRRRAANVGGSDESHNENDIDSCQSLTLDKPMDSSKPMEWWAGVHSLREQLGLIR